MRTEHRILEPKNIFGTKTFVLGAYLGGILFVLLSLGFKGPYGDTVASICFDCYEAYGFPFTVYESGTAFNLGRYLWLGIFLNLLVGFLFSFLMGILTAYFFRLIAYFVNRKA